MTNELHPLALSPSPEPNPEARTPYAAPRLVVHGCIEAITHQGAGGLSGGGDTGDGGDPEEPPLMAS